VAEASEKWAGQSVLKASILDPEGVSSEMPKASRGAVAYLGGTLGIG